MWFVVVAAVAKFTRWFDQIKAKLFEGKETNVGQTEKKASEKFPTEGEGPDNDVCNPS